MKYIKYVKISVWIITLIWMSIIFYFSNQPVEVSRLQSGKILVNMELLQSGEEDIVGDNRILYLQNAIRKSAHFIEYFGLGILITASMSLSRIDKSLEDKSIRKRDFNLEFKIGNIFTMSWLYSTIYAISDELHQYFIPGRGAMVRDVYLDSIAALIGVLVTWSVINIATRTIEFS